MEKDDIDIDNYEGIDSHEEWVREPKKSKETQDSKEDFVPIEDNVIVSPSVEEDKTELPELEENTDTIVVEETNTSNLPISRIIMVRAAITPIMKINNPSLKPQKLKSTKLLFVLKNSK